MKKIFFSVLAIAAIAACTKSEVQYDAPQEIGFTAVAGNITKSVVDGTTYPEDLNFYVFAETNTNTASASDYINNGEFKYKTTTDAVKYWGGWNGSDYEPYYWPNVKTLHFAGYSKAGVSGTASFDWNDDNGTLSITGYNPGTSTVAGANDLMFFPNTALATPDGYGKTTANGTVTVQMYHTCAWITFLVQGDGVTSGKYTVTELVMSGIDQTADVSCHATYADSKYTPVIVWSNNTTNTGDNTTYTVPVVSGGILLSKTEAKDVEKNAPYDAASNAGGNVVVIPQVPGKLSVKYTYTAPNGTSTIEETVEGLDLKVGEGDANKWDAGKHYIYTLTVTANEILIAPTIPTDWNDSNVNPGVTVQ